MEDNKYSRGKIYRLVNTTDNEVYVGSTCNTLNRRLYNHRNKAKHRTSKVYAHLSNIGWDKVQIELLEEYPCNNVQELLAKEREYIEQLKPTLNSSLPTRTNKEYKQHHREQVLESSRKYEKIHHEERKASHLQYRQNNRAFLAACSKEYYDANKEKVAERKKLYRQNNKDKIKEQNDKHNEKIIQKTYQQMSVLKTDNTTHNNINIEIVITTLPNAQQIKYFLTQFQILNNANQITSLKDLFDVIVQDPEKWLSNLPTTTLSESTFGKYKTPLKTLLESSQVIDSLGAEFCDTTYKTLRKGYKQHIDKILKRNKAMNITSLHNRNQIDNIEKSVLIPCVDTPS